MIRDVEPLPGYPEAYGLLAAVLQDGTREWRGEMESELSADAMVWQPHPGMPSIGALILHIISVEVTWFERFVLRLADDPDERKLLMADEIDVDEGCWPVPPRRPLSWYYALHDRIRVRTLEGIQSWPAPETLLPHREGMRSARWVLGHVIQHEAYHGGQAVMLNRLKELADSNGS